MLQEKQFQTNEPHHLYAIVGHGPYWRSPSGWCISTGGQSDKERRLNGDLHVIIQYPEIEHKDCTVCTSSSEKCGRWKKGNSLCL